ncbi:MAG TPA: iron-containing redox enzyme family protein [Nitrospiria bacterium]|nr:iron-containing redox enzyme family protein [Nitrospiria bacterium]
MAGRGRAAARPDRSFQERLLAVMDRKHHWAWPVFSGNRITLDRLKIHFQQEFSVYVRDFPLLLGRLYAKNPPEEIRRELAANLYEEETGGLSVGRSHPALFLEMMKGLGFSERDFSRIRLLPASRIYRQWLDRVTTSRSWLEGLAVMTIFVEGSVKERQELADEAAGHRPKSDDEIDAAIRNHPLVQFHGVDPKAMDLIRAHQRVEHGHRLAAWQMVLRAAVTPSQQRAVSAAIEKSLDLWLRYRDGVAKACGITRDS